MRLQALSHPVMRVESSENVISSLNSVASIELTLKKLSLALVVDDSGVNRKMIIKPIKKHFEKIIEVSIE